VTVFSLQSGLPEAIVNLLLKHYTKCPIECLDPQILFDPAEQQLSGEGLARHLGERSARFQSLPMGTAREVFPQAARPADFLERVMDLDGVGKCFHVYASTF